MVPHLVGAGVDKRVIVVAVADQEGICFNGLSFEPHKIPHNVPNCCWHISVNGTTIFYATDCSTIDGITAKDYDYFLVEANHNKAEIEQKIAEKQANKQFSYEYFAAHNHLSEEQTMNWLAQNIGPNSKVIFLHQHKDKEKREDRGEVCEPRTENKD